MDGLMDHLLFYQPSTPSFNVHVYRHPYVGRTALTILQCYHDDINTLTIQQYQQ